MATVAQKTVRQLPDGVLVISVFRATGDAATSGGTEGLLYSSGGSSYSFVVRQIAQRDVAPLPGAREVFATRELPSLPLSDQNQLLERVDLKADGRSRSHRSGGVEVILAIEGRVEVHSGTFSPTQLNAGEGVYVLDNTPLQAWSIGGRPASYLDYHLLPSGRAPASDYAYSP